MAVSVAMHDSIFGERMQQDISSIGRPPVGYTGEQFILMGVSRNVIRATDTRHTDFLKT